MSNTESRRFVIDAGIARSSGGEAATAPNAKACRDFLKSVLSVCHQIVMSEDIKAEWNKHKSNFALSWRKSMIARKKLVLVKNGSTAGRQSQRLVEVVRGSDLTDKQQDALEKDLHLVTAALATDCRVASNDETVRNLFGRLTTDANELKSLLWVNPTREEEDVIDWLERGAPDEPSRKLAASTKT